MTATASVVGLSAHDTASATAHRTASAHAKMDETRDSAGRWFHGSNRVFKPGDIIDPSQAHAKNMQGSADDRFYLTSDVKTAKTYADMVSGHNPILGKRPGMSGEPHVYEVEPMGPIEPDYRPGTARTPGKVRVVREVPHKQGGTAVQAANTWDDLASVIDLAATAPAPAPAKAGRMTSVTAAGNAAARTTPPEGRSAGIRRQPAAVTPPKARPRHVPLTPMRRDTAKSIRKLAAHVQGTHPEMAVHDHLRDAARVLEAGNEEGAQRHLRAAIGSLTPQALYRHGISTDDGHIQGKQAMAGVHRHLLLVKDIMDAGEKNRAAIARHAGGDDTAPPPPPVSPARPDLNAGYGPGALAQKPTARQPGGGRAMNAPDRTSSGGSDPAAADPQGPQPGGSKQMARTWDELADVIDLAWIASPSKAEWAAIDAKSGHSVPDAKDGSDEDKADAHIRFARQATNIGQHDVAMKHLARASALTSDPGKQAAVNTLRGAVAKNAALRGQSQQLIGLSAETGRLAVTPAPYGKPGGPGLYGVKGLKHSDYLEQVVQALMRRGMDKGKATAIARGSIRRWMAKSKHPEVRAAAGLAEGQEIAAQARAHAHATTWDDVGAVVELATVGR